jgi:hypothetical protein
MPSTSSADTSDYPEDDTLAIARVFGNLKTRLRWEPQDSALHIDVRQQIETTRAMEGKLKGWLNTKSGRFQSSFFLRKNFYTNTPSIAKIMDKEDGKHADINPERCGGQACKRSNILRNCYRRASSAVDKWALAVYPCSRISNILH